MSNTIDNQDNVDIVVYPSMSEATANLLNQEFLADIKFDVEDQKMYAHSHELSKRSPVFAQLYRETIGTMTLVAVPNCTYATFYEFLKYLYTDACQITRTNALSLLNLSIKYEIISLVTLVRVYLIENLAIDNVLEFYEFCLVENYIQPIEDLTNFISENYYVILTQNRNFLKISLQTLIELLKFVNIDNVTREADVYNAMLKWVKNHCLKNSLHQNVKCKREILNDAIKLIRFPVMKSDEFSRLIENDKELLTIEEVNSIFLCIALKQNVNSFGFETTPRAIGIDYSTGSDIKLNMRPYIGLEMQTPGSNQNTHSIFTLTQNIIFTGIEIGVSKMPQSIRIELQNVSGQILREVRYNFSNQEDWKKGWIPVNFSLPFLLKQKHIYQLRLEYLKPTLAAYCLPSKRPQLIHSVNKNCEIKFDKISPFLLQMNLKECKK